MIVTVCLSKGALAMSRKKVIVKRINAIQNLGAMDVLCTDKTGTLTMDHVILEKHCDVALKEDEGVLALAYMNSHFQTGLRNVLDRAVLAHTETHSHAKIPNTQRWTRSRSTSSAASCRSWSVRRRARTESSAREPRRPSSRAAHTSISTARSTRWITPTSTGSRRSTNSFRPMASACSRSPVNTLSRAVSSRGTQRLTPKADECDLILNGYAAFLDPP
jgi:P-type Mg2+ transporter